MSKFYRVTGYALVPVEVSVKLESVSKEDANTMAKTLFRASPRRYLVPGTIDESAACDFIPNECEEL